MVKEEIKKHSLPCSNCGIEVERSYKRLTATCFDCTMERIVANNAKRREIKKNMACKICLKNCKLHKR